MAHIAVLEDDDVFARLLKTSLHAEGHDVKTYSTVDDILLGIHEHPVDLVVADLFISEGDRNSIRGGVFLTSQLKQIINHPAPVIGISGSFGNENGTVFREAIKSVGADAILAKPFAPSDLLDLVDDLLAKATSFN